MPSYEYKCQTCEQTMNVVRSIYSNDPGYFCGNCNKPMIQVLGGVAVSFKGGGWAHKE
jgi:putative FmdB family regulatory protein